MRKLPLIPVLLVLAALVLPQAPAWAQRKDAPQKKPAPCTAAMSDKAEQLASRLRTWDDVQSFYRSYRYCNNAAAEASYGNSVAKLLADEWKSLPRLAALAHRNDNFLDFVLWGINSDDDMADVRGIRDHAAYDCPRGQKSLCRDIYNSAQDAIDDEAEVRGWKTKL